VTPRPFDLTGQVALVTGAGSAATVNAIAPGWIATSSSTERELAMGRASPPVARLSLWQRQTQTLRALVS
jgi:NAD(P)-dependent dehydrogenase (short-subunit alcohol dehydrogenase family)